MKHLLSRVSATALAAWVGCAPAMAEMATGGQPFSPPVVNSGPPITNNLPCDAYASAGTACVAAHSCARRLTVAYVGALCQIERLSDSTTYDITQTSGVANLTGVAAFCAATNCFVSKVYDQMGNGNDLTNSTPLNGPWLSFAYLPSGKAVPLISTISGEYFRNRTSTSKIPVGNTAITEYMVAENHVNSLCCGAYGDVEATIADTGNGHMFQVGLSTGTQGTFGIGSGPWPGVDLENGVFLYGQTPSYNYTTVLAKYSPNTGLFTVSGQDATAPASTMLYNGALPTGWSPLAMEGGLSLGEGGDGSGSPTNFLEGAVLASTSTATADSAVQNMISNFYGPNAAYPAGCMVEGNFLNSPAPLGLAANWHLVAASNTPASDPFGGNTGATIAGTALYSTLAAQMNMLASKTYTFETYIKSTSGATVFPGVEIQNNASPTNQIASFYIDTNAGTVAVSSVNTATLTSLTSTAYGSWWFVKMVFTTPVGTYRTYVDLDPVLFSNTGVKAAQGTSYNVTHACPVLLLGAH